MNSRVTTDDLPDRLRILTQATQQLHAGIESDEVLRLLVQFAVELSVADAGAAGLHQDGEICFKAILNDNNWQTVDRCFSHGEGIAGWLLEQTELFICPGCQDDPRAAWQKQQVPGVRSLVAVPIMGGREGRLLGCLELYNKQSDTGFSAQAIALLQALVASAAGALENLRRLEAHVDKQRDMESCLERFMRSQQFSDIGTWDWNIQTGELYWSERIGPLFGYPPGALETSYENFLSAVHPDDRQTVIDAVNACIERSEPYEVEHRVVWPDGTVRWVLERGDVSRDAAGLPLRMLGVVKDVTRRKRAEASLREQRDFAEVVIETAQSIVLVLDTSGRIVLFNPYLEEISGYSLEEVKGQDWFKCFLPLSKAIKFSELYQEGIENILLRGKVGPIFTKSGEFREIEWYYKTLKDQQGKVIGLLATGQDITHRRETEYALRESEARFRGLVESTSDWIWEVDQQGLYTYVSPQVESMLGYSPDSLIGKSPFDLMPPAERNRLRTEFFSLVKHQQPISRLVNTNIDVSGKEVILETSGVPFYDSYGRFLGYRGIDRDISDRIAAERALKVQTLRNRLILENSHDGLVILNLDGSIREVNDAYCRMLGYDRNVLVGKRLSDLKVPGYAPEVAARIKRIMEYGYDHFESSHRCRDGRVIDLDISATLAKIGDDQFIFSFVRDITERRLKEQKRLKEVQAQRDTLVKEVHHRIKNHLQGIINLLRNHIQDKPELAEVMESAISQVESIALVHGLQSRLSQGMVELADLLEMICKAVGHLTSAGIQLEIDCPGTDIVIRPNDAVPLALIINELLQNAVKHGGPTGTSSSAITARLLTEDENVILLVSNPSAVALPVNFNLQEGLGLGTGLTLARDLLPHQGAELSLTCKEGRVIARLILQTPVISLERKRLAQDFSVPNRLM
ncbi:PAS domain S-box protein [Sedimenticola selenatireducens]|uniref:PAS domain S-box protein n=1 Tax=Sedimenticola selenatireducens TaxID=191960 RepID=UPI002AAB88C3|nr:PAS domain S-box protein [Sedimenticola selenatireducens]